MEKSLNGAVVNLQIDVARESLLTSLTLHLSHPYFILIVKSFWNYNMTCYIHKGATVRMKLHHIQNLRIVSTSNIFLLLSS